MVEGACTGTWRVYLFGHLDQCYKGSNGSENWRPFVRHYWITFIFLHLFRASISFACTSWNSISTTFPRKDKWEKRQTYNYVTKRTKQLVKMAALISYSIAGPVVAPKLICLDIDFSGHLDQWITNPFFQAKDPNKRPGYRMKKVLYLILSLSYQWHYFSFTFSQILINVLIKKLGFRIFIFVSSWNISKTINIPSSLEPLSSKNVNAHFLWKRLVWNYLVSCHGPTRGGLGGRSYLWGTFYVWILILFKFWF